MHTTFLDRQSPPHIVTLVLIAGLAALSLNMFLPSLPGMAAHFGVDYALMQLSVSAYLAVSAVMQLLVGPISDRFGRRRVVMAALVVFLLATLGTLLAPSAGMFLGFRLMQAVVATTFVLSRAVVRDMVPEAEAASMIGYVTMGIAMVPMVGPVIGGALDEAIGWQANFVFLLLFGCATLGLVWGDMGETTRRGGVSFAEQARQYPILLRSRRFWGYCLSSVFASGLFFAYLGGAPFVGTQVFGLSPAQVGYYFALPALGYAMGSFLSGRFAKHVGTDKMVLAGTLVATLALSLAIGLETLGMSHPLIFFGAVGVTGIGNGLALPSANAGLMAIRPELAGTASGLAGTLTIGGGAALSALAGAMLGPGSGAMVLIVLMTLSSAASVLAILWVMRRRAQLGV
ncbi:multidrug effflux MFS transporter [Phaeovulum sp. NW3]|uniref:multidrug effflux MFS transporter n=1 Tax=Phaeovulum sp. NW3 TaxID=2934933 RepID=UPI00201FE9C9|nr:multidrug effflux MFS transporter [Phaeovulum sp. NW3]MCL7464989.1 multidrug effflux MFS transporter [Phaeovulum sp. NW3]